jgi:hypothetical protein
MEGTVATANPQHITNAAPTYKWGPGNNLPALPNVFKHPYRL